MMKNLDEFESTASFGVNHCSSQGSEVKHNKQTISKLLSFLLLEENPAPPEMYETLSSACQDGVF